MSEEDKKRDNLERAKTIMGKIDPELLSAALSEMMMEADEAEEADVAKVKEAIKRIHSSIPEGKDKKSIISKAFTELDSDIIDKEVKTIKENLASIDKETIIEAAKDYVDIPQLCKYLIYCAACITYVVKPCGLGCITYAVKPCPLGCITYVVKPCLGCISYAVKPCLLGCITYAVKPVCPTACIKYAIPTIPEVPDLPEWGIDPRVKEQLKEEIIQELLQRPELSRAMKKMLKKIQDEK